MFPKLSSVIFLVFVLTGDSKSKVKDSGLSITRCVGDSVDLVWDREVDVNETEHIIWTFEASEHPLEELATFEKDSNFTATDRRLEHLGGANIRLQDLTMEDDGVVTCSIHFPPSKKTSVVFLKARIRVTVPPEVFGNELILKMNKTAVKDENSGKWAITLRCGDFLEPGHPVLYPVVKTPHGGFVVMSEADDAEENFYVYHMTSDNVESGEYECRLPVSPVCPRPLPKPGSVLVDEAIVHLLMVSAKLRDVEHILHEIRPELHETQKKFEHSHHERQTIVSP